MPSSHSHTLETLFADVYEQNSENVVKNSCWKAGRPLLTVLGTNRGPNSTY